MATQVLRQPLVKRDEVAVDRRRRVDVSQLSRPPQLDDVLHESRDLIRAAHQPHLRPFLRRRSEIVYAEQLREPLGMVDDGLQRRGIEGAEDVHT